MRTLTSDDLQMMVRDARRHVGVRGGWCRTSRSERAGSRRARKTLSPPASKTDRPTVAAVGVAPNALHPIEIRSTIAPDDAIPQRQDRQSETGKLSYHLLDSTYTCQALRLSRLSRDPRECALFRGVQSSSCYTERFNELTVLFRPTRPTALEGAPYLGAVPPQLQWSLVAATSHIYEREGSCTIRSITNVTCDEVCFMVRPRGGTP